ncbi:MAG: hypothetical protein C0392_04190 [Syntrophus sp. (in: bacteria)]|nr:hypothetical protein [Syntrophus sp. (in: bacteria)]
MKTSKENSSIEVKQLNVFVDTLEDFEIVIPNVPYNHMGATITDSILQAGLKWSSVVKPRLDRLKKDYPEAITTDGFNKIIEKAGIKVLINWKDSEKPNRIMRLTELFLKEGVENEVDLKAWLGNHTNIQKLEQIKGIGNKTVDYLKWLSGIPTAAVDIHLFRFLELAGIFTKDYFEAKGIINGTADLRGLNRTVFDHSIWKYMSEGKKVRPCK